MLVIINSFCRAINNVGIICNLTFAVLVLAFDERVRVHSNINRDSQRKSEIAHTRYDNSQMLWPNRSQAHFYVCNAHITILKCAFVDRRIFVYEEVFRNAKMLVQIFFFSSPRTNSLRLFFFIWQRRRFDYLFFFVEYEWLRYISPKLPATCIECKNVILLRCQM